MRIDAVAARPLQITFKPAFRHASAERSSTQAIWVEARCGDHVGFGEGCPRGHATGESVGSALAFVAGHVDEWRERIRFIQDLGDYVTRQAATIDEHPAAWCAVELALLDLLGKVGGLAVERLIGTPSVGGSFYYTAVLGDAPPAAFEALLAAYARAGMRQYKVRLSGDVERDGAKLDALTRAGVHAPAVRADASNLFADADAAIEHLRALRYPFAAVVEPVRAGDMEGMRRIARELGTRIVLDESLARADQLEGLRDHAALWIGNLRVSKMGGLLRSVSFTREAQRIGLELIVGADFGETSLLTRVGMTIADLAGRSLYAQEGAFGTHLLERDVVEKPLMFGREGKLLLLHGFAPRGLGMRVTEPSITGTTPRFHA
ncbi:MAG TPA: enolase C-terminal domain-like protein [Usitatibacter sp.]|nr:enolase C-terminal domain-like protein [Usitatibacter sp.]